MLSPFDCGESKPESNRFLQSLEGGGATSKDTNRVLRNAAKAIHCNPKAAKIATRIQTVAPIAVGILKVLK